MSRIYDALRRIETPRQQLSPVRRGEPRPYQVVSVASNKGGVGKTTVASNLAVYIRALREDLPLLFLSLDDQSTLDRMFALEASRPHQTTATALRSAELDPAIRLGQYGVHYVPSDPGIAELKRKIDDPFFLRRILRASSWHGLLIVDTKSDLEILTRNAIAASDLVIVLVSDHASLVEAEKVFELLDAWKQPRERARILLSLVDLRIKYREGQDRDVLSLLVSSIRERGYPLFESFLSRSAKVESLYTNPEGRATSILHGAKHSLVSRQMDHLARDVLERLEGDPVAALTTTGASVVLSGLTSEAAQTLRSGPLRVERFPFTIGRDDPLLRNDLSIRDSRPWQVSRRHAALVRCEGRIGIVDRGSRLGSIVNGRVLGGPSADRGPLLLDGAKAKLVLGKSTSPFQFEVARV